ncbi:formyltransferase family protein [Flagellimonas sp. S3867]|uniref:formyltransferase family protein n=1 Tax=Flagellimonas sp. S3867 TaxID=2768063 RepID=UPI0016863928|nr:formyltransferase family protein [Flagellimonas sp. S3867]
MDVIILTSNLLGSASLHLEELITSDKIDIKMVVYNQGKVSNKKKYYSRRLKKLIKVGPLGALNGIRMRKWYTNKTFGYLNIKPIDALCKQYDIPFKSTTSINCPETVSLFENANVDLGISIGNTYIGRKVYSVPKYGMINIHYEELPEYQNAIGVIWQLHNNSSHTGYTIHAIDRHIDTGNILLKEILPITFRPTLADTVANTYAKVWLQSTKGLLMVVEDFLSYFENKTPQAYGNSYTTPTFMQYLTIRKKFKQLKNKVVIPKL